MAVGQNQWHHFGVGVPPILDAALQLVLLGYVLNGDSIGMRAVDRRWPVKSEVQGAREALKQFKRQELSSGQLLPISRRAFTCPICAQGLEHIWRPSAWQ